MNTIENSHNLIRARNNERGTLRCTNLDAFSWYSFRKKIRGIRKKTEFCGIRICRICTKKYKKKERMNDCYINDER